MGFMDHPLNKKMGDSIQHPLTTYILPPQATVQLQRFPDQIVICNIHGGLLVVLDIDSDIPIVYFLGLVPQNLIVRHIIEYLKKEDKAGLGFLEF